MIKELEYMIIEFTEKDLDYFDSFIKRLEEVSNEIVAFFDMNEFGEKINIKIYDSLDEFRDYCFSRKFLDSTGNVPLWLCGLTCDFNIVTLTLDEYRKTKGHYNATLEDLEMLILHEFTHACENKKRKVSKKHYLWLSEGLASSLSHQMDKVEPMLNATLDQMIDGEHVDYKNYYAMFKYVLDNYGRDYILSLVDNYDLLISDTPRLYEEAREYYKKL